MRRCYHTSYPRRVELNEQGQRVRTVALPPVKCQNVAVIRSTIHWNETETQHTYACAEHIDNLKELTTSSGWGWNPQPYKPNSRPSN